MQNSEIITGLRNLAQTGTQYRRTVCRLAADTIEAQQKRIQELESQAREMAAFFEDVAGIAKTNELCPICAHNFENKPCEQADFNCMNCKENDTCVCMTCIDPTFSNANFKWRGNKEETP